MSHIRSCLAVLVCCLSSLSAAASAKDKAPGGCFLTVGCTSGKDAHGHVIEGQFGTIYYSKDGQTWENVFRGGVVKEKFDHSNCNALRCLTYGNGVFIVAGNRQNLYRSTDGRAWQLVPIEDAGFSVAYGNGQFVIPFAAWFRVSPDGLHWTKNLMQPELPVWGKGGTGHIRKIVFGNGTFVCVGETFLGATKDCRHWDHHEIFPESLGQQSLAFGAGRFVWLREKAPHLTSTDGLHWTPLAIPADRGPTWNGLWAGNEFLVGGKDCYLRSADGVAWTASPMPRYTSAPTTVGNSLFVAGRWPSGFSVSRDGGRTWRTAGEGITVSKVYFFNGKEIIGPNGG